MKKFVVNIVLVVLLVVELYLCSIFFMAVLPTRWEHAIDQALFRVLPPDHSAVTHPNLDLEIDQALQQLPWLRFGLYTFYVLSLALNTFLMIRTWKALRPGPRREQVFTDQNL